MMSVASDSSDMCHPYTLQIPSTTVTTVGGALFFLMVFRTNASYDRWWEGRKRWGMVINRTRDLTRQACHYIDAPAIQQRVAQPLDTSD